MDGLEMFAVGYGGLTAVSIVVCLALANRAGNEPPKLIKYRGKQTTERDWIDDQGRLVDSEPQPPRSAA